MASLFIIVVYEAEATGSTMNAYAIAAEDMAEAEEIGLKKAVEEDGFEDPQIENGLSFEVTVAAGKYGELHVLHDVHLGTAYKDDIRNLKR